MLARVSPACELTYNAKLSLKKKRNQKQTKLLGAREFGPLRMAIIFCVHANFNI